jgi:hypothetical protein
MVGVAQAIGLGVAALGVTGLGCLEIAPSRSVEGALTAPLGWQRIREVFRRENDDRGAGNNNGSRPVAGLCLVSPASGQVLWHRNPVLVWQGYSTVGIRPLGEDDQVLWQGTIREKTSEVYQAYYPGEPLEPGQGYEWLFYISQREPALWFPFEIMAAEQHEQHAAALEGLQRDLVAGGVSETEIALAKAEYFVGHDLPGDALQVMFAVSEPSEELVATREAVIHELCSDN